MTEHDVAAGATYQSAERVLALLTTFDESRTEIGVTEMAESLGVHKSTASRLAAALERTGFLSRAGKRYRFESRLVEDKGRVVTTEAEAFDVESGERVASGSAKCVRLRT